MRKADKAEQQASAAGESRQDQGLPLTGSFETVAREWVATIHAATVSPGHAARRLIRFEQGVIPWLRRAARSEIEAPELLAVLRRVEARGALETTHRIKDACGQVFRYGIACGVCKRNPAADLNDALQPVKTKHMAAVTDPKGVGAILRLIDVYMGFPTTRAALQIAPLVFRRPGNLRMMEWSEVDLDAAVWTIPAAKMTRSVPDKS